MLRATSYRDLKVVDIAREAATSPGTFYQYFPDVESAILALADEMVGQGRRGGVGQGTRAPKRWPMSSSASGTSTRRSCGSSTSRQMRATAGSPTSGPGS